MFGRIFITRSGYDPQLGRHVKDPYLGKIPSIGACRTDFRTQLRPGDHLFVISGKVKGHNQFVMGGFEVARKISAIEAYEEFPEQRLRALPNGELAGNIIVDRSGNQHPLDDHGNFHNRIKNYIVGTNPIALDSDDEIQRGRNETIPVLQDIMKSDGRTPYEIVGRYGSKVSDVQISKLRDWLSSLKVAN